MCPPAAMAWRMWIVRAISVGVVYAVRHYPLNGTTFERQRAAGNEKVFNQFRYFVTAVGYQPVIAHADTKTTANPVKHDSSYYRRPTPKEERCDGAKMGANQKDRGAPIALGPINAPSLRRRCGAPTLF